MTNKIKDIRAKFGVKVRAERKKRGFSQEKLAELSEMSRNYVSAIENGTSGATLDMLCRLAHAFDMKISELVALD